MSEPVSVRFVALLRPVRHPEDRYLSTLVCLEGPTAMFAERSRAQAVAAINAEVRSMMSSRRPRIDRAEMALVETADEQLFSSLENLTPDLWTRAISSTAVGTRVTTSVVTR